MSNVEFVRLPEAAKRLGIARTRIYELAKAGKVPVVRLTANTMRVPARWLEELEAKAFAAIGAARK